MNRATRHLGEHPKAIGNQTEIAQLMSLIQHEYELATWAATGILDENARKIYIRRRYQAISQHREHLSHLVGEAQTTRMVQATIEQPSTQKQHGNGQ